MFIEFKAHYIKKYKGAIVDGGHRQDFFPKGALWFKPTI